MKGCRSLTLVALLALAPMLMAQEQIDKADAVKQAADALKQLTMRVRVTAAEPTPKLVRIDWRRGGEGLGGPVIRGSFVAEGPPDEILPNRDLPLDTWSAWTPVSIITGGVSGAGREAQCGADELGLSVGSAASAGGDVASGVAGGGPGESGSFAGPRPVAAGGGADGGAATAGRD
jgi:hypothetical protein